MPKKEDTKKTNKGKGAGSRPCSPDRELVNGVGSGRPKAIVGRKRKANAMDKAPDEVYGLVFTHVLTLHGAYGSRLCLFPLGNLCPEKLVKHYYEKFCKEIFL